MKENVCMLCRRRQCSFRSYTREDCPYAPKPPQLYEQDSESEARQEAASDWQKKNPFLIKHFHIKEPELAFDVSKITRRLMAEVTDTTDAVIVEAIRKEAARQGFTDLYLIDRELVKNVITGAIQKRVRYIDTEKLPQLFREGTDENGDALVSLSEVRKALRLATVEEPVRRGEWKRDCDGESYCSVCGAYSNTEREKCPVCGAKMNREEERKQ